MTICRGVTEVARMMGAKPVESSRTMALATKAVMTNR